MSDHHPRCQSRGPFFIEHGPNECNCNQLAAAEHEHRPGGAIGCHHCRELTVAGLLIEDEYAYVRRLSESWSTRDEDNTFLKLVNAYDSLLTEVSALGAEVGVQVRANSVLLVQIDDWRHVLKLVGQDAAEYDLCNEALGRYPPGHCAGPSWSPHEVAEVATGECCPYCGMVMP